MMPGDLLQLIPQAGMLVFVVAGMAAMGLALAVGRIAEPLRDLRLVGGLLLANFVLVPAAAVATVRLLPVAPGASTAIVLVGCVAGAPFLTKLAQLAKGDIALAVGGMVLLMVVTVGYAPLVVPRLLEGATVDARQIALSLVATMLIPLGAGLAVRARFAAPAARAQPAFARASTIGLVIGLAGGVVVSWRDIVGSVGTWIFVGTAIVVVAGIAAGWLVGLGRPPRDRAVLSLATGQRNIAAAIVIAGSIGGDPVIYTVVAALVVTLSLIAVAAAVGRRLGAAVSVQPAGGSPAES